MRSALEMHELGVQLYRQRMRREHPYANRADIDDLVRAWLAAPPPDTRLRLPSREHHVADRYQARSTTTSPMCGEERITRVSPVHL
jgi:Rv0078B-related antitoxin